jgi:uncharacterized protein DUF4349
VTPHEVVSPERLEALLAGAAPGGSAERELAGLVQELRAASPPAPEALRERVRATAAAAPGRVRTRGLRLPRLPRGRRGRIAAGLAPALAALAALLVVVLLPRGGGPAPVPAGVEAAPTPPNRPAPSLAAPARPSARAAVPGAPGTAGPAPQRGRPQDLRAATTVRVPDARALSRAGTRAMATVRGLGGYTARADASVGGARSGRAGYTFRVPAARAQDALLAFSRLGTVVAQHARLQDLGAALDAGSRRIARLTDRVRERAAALRRDPANPALRRALDRARADLRAARDAQAATRGRAALATLTLTLTTASPAAAPGPGRGAVDRAVDALSAVGAALLVALLVAGPFLVLAGGGLLGWRALRRRADRRALERTGPG